MEMEWWQVLAILTAGIGMLAGAAYGVLVVVVREKERIYQQYRQAEKAQEEMRAHFSLFPLGLDEGAVQSKLPGFLAQRGVRITNSSRAALILKVAMKEIQEVSYQPTQKEIGEAWFEEWYNKEGKYQIFKRPNMAGEVRPDLQISHREEARNHCQEPTQVQWESISVRLTKIKTHQEFEVSLEAGGELLLQRSYRDRDLEKAAEDIRALVLALELDSGTIAEADWERVRGRMAAEAEEGGEAVKVKRGL